MLLILASNLLSLPFFPSAPHPGTLPTAPKPPVLLSTFFGPNKYASVVSQNRRDGYIVNWTVFRDKRLSMSVREV